MTNEEREERLSIIDGYFQDWYVKTYNDEPNFSGNITQFYREVFRAGALSKTTYQFGQSVGERRRRNGLIRRIGNVCRAARTVQMQCDYRPDSYQGANKTAIAKAAAKERNAIRDLITFIGYPAPSKGDLERCQNADEDKAV